MWLLPWEKWLPAWLLGPILVAIAVGALVLDKRLSWWEWILLPLTAVFGAWGTWMWFSKGENIFNPSRNAPKSGATED
jgi:hypothetical protein